MNRGVIGPLRRFRVAFLPRSGMMATVTATRPMLGGVPGPRRERPMAASTGTGPPRPLGMVPRVAEGVVLLTRPQDV